MMIYGRCRRLRDPLLLLTENKTMMDANRLELCALQIEMLRFQREDDDATPLELELSIVEMPPSLGSRTLKLSMCL